MHNAAFLYILSIMSGKSTLHILLIFLFCLISYINIIPNELVNYDDQINILKNERITREGIINAVKLFNPTPVMRGIIPLKNSEYLPLRDISYWIDYKLWGENPIGYHLTNLLLYLILCIFIYLFIKMIIPETETALFATLIYACHPIHTESVAWASSRKDLLFALFFIVSNMCFLRYLNENLPGKKYLFYVFSFIASILSWFSKTAAVTIPGSLMLLYLLPVKHRRISRIFFELLPFIIIMLSFAYFNLFFIRGVSPSIQSPEPGMITGLNYLRLYTTDFLFPQRLNPVRAMPEYFGIADTTTVLSALLLGGYVYLSLKSRMYLFCISFFILNLFPVLNATGLGRYIVQERYMLIPSLGLCLLLGIAADSLKPRRHIPLFIILLLSSLTLLTIRQNTFWKDSISLWKHTVSSSPAAGLAHLNLGSAYAEKGLEEGAKNEFLSVLNSSFATPNIRAYALRNLGTLHLKKNEYESALKYFQSALDGHPDPAELHRIIGGLYVKLKKPEEALKHFRTTLELNPDYPDRELIEEFIKMLSSSPAAKSG